MIQEESEEILLAEKDRFGHLVASTFGVVHREFGLKGVGRRNWLYSDM